MTNLPRFTQLGIFFGTPIKPQEIMKAYCKFLYCRREIMLKSYNQSLKNGRTFSWVHHFKLVYTRELP